MRIHNVTFRLTFFLGLLLIIAVISSIGLECEFR